MGCSNFWRAMNAATWQTLSGADSVGLLFIKMLRLCVAFCQSKRREGLLGPCALYSGRQCRGGGWHPGGGRLLIYARKLQLKGGCITVHDVILGCEELVKGD